MVDPIPEWIRIRVISIPAPLDEISAPDPDPHKSGIVTPLAHTPAPAGAVGAAGAGPRSLCRRLHRGSDPDT